MMNAQFEQLNELNNMVEKQNEFLDNFSEPLLNVFESLNRVFRRFRPSKLLNFLEDSAEAVKKEGLAFENMMSMEDWFDNLIGKVSDMGSGEDMLKSLEELQSILDVDVREDMNIGNLNLEGVEEPPKEVFESIQYEIDAMSNKANLFYETVIEEKFEDEFMEDKFEEFKEGTEDWLEEMNEMMRDLFHRDKDFREFGRDRRDSLDDMKEEIDDTGEEIKDNLGGMFSGDWAGIGALFSLGGIRGELQGEVTSLEDVREDFQEQLGKSREDWARFFNTTVQGFRQLNEESGYAFSYTEDFIPALSTAINTDVSDPEVLEEMTNFAVEFGSALEGVDLENWLFVRKSISEWGEEGVEAIKRVGEHVAWLDNEAKMHFKSEEIMSVIENWDSTLRSYVDSAEEYKDMQMGIAEASGMISHTYLDSAEVMDDLLTIMRKGEAADSDLITRFSEIEFKDIDRLQERLREGDFEEVAYEYLVNVRNKLTDMRDDSGEEYMLKFAERMGFEEDEVYDFLNAEERIEEAYSKVPDHLEESVGYVKEFNKESKPKTWIGVAKNWIMSSDAAIKFLDYWNESGLQGEFILGSIMLYREIREMGFFSNLKKLPGLLSKSKGVASGLLAPIKSVVAASWGWAASIAANPLFWIPAVIVSIAAGTYLLVKHWDKIKDFADKHLGFLKPIFKFTKNTAALSWTIFDSLLSSIPVVGELWGLYKNINKTVGDKLFSNLKSIGGFVVENLISGFKAVKDIIGWIIGLDDGEIGVASDGLSLTDRGDKLSGLDLLKKNIKNKMQETVDGVLDSISFGIYSKIKDQWKDLKTGETAFKIKELFKFDFNLVDWFNDQWELAKDNLSFDVGDLFSGGWGKFKDWISGSREEDINKVGSGMRPHLSMGAVAMREANVTVAENEPEAIVPLSKWKDLINDIGFGFSDNIDRVGITDYINDLSVNSEMGNLPETIMQLVNNNDDIVDIIEWQTKRLENKLDEIIDNGSKDKDYRRDIKNKELKDKIKNLR